MNNGNWRRSAVVALLSLSAIVAGIFLHGGTTRQALHQLIIFMLSTGFFLALSLLLPTRWRGVISLAYSAWAVLWAFTLSLRAYLIYAFKAEPRSLLIVQAIANTTPEEAWSYVQQYRFELLFFTALMALAAKLLSVAFRSLTHLIARPTTRSWKVAALAMVALTLMAHSNRAIRRDNAPFYWMRAHNDLRAWLNTQDGIEKNKVVARAKIGEWAPVYSGPEAKTVVVVFGESHTRSNFSLYGYARKTNPELARHNDLCIFDNVYSASAATVAAFIDMLGFSGINPVIQSAAAPPGLKNRPLPDWRVEPNAVMLAKAAGYEVIWLSNQNDRFVNSVFGSEASNFTLLNIGGSREDTSMDAQLIPEVEKALATPAPRKLIIVHLIGAHPHYDLRYTKEFEKFGDDDSVAEAMRRRSVFPWVRSARNHYDNSILYTDMLVAKMLDRLKATSGAKEFLFLSDHGQEVGHSSNHVGHAPQYQTGYEIPFLFYSSIDGDKCGQMQNRLYQTDRFSWTLLGRLGVTTTKSDARHDLMSDAFTAVPLKTPWREAQND